MLLEDLGRLAPLPLQGFRGLVQTLRFCAILTLKSLHLLAEHRRSLLLLPLLFRGRFLSLARGLLRRGHLFPPSQCRLPLQVLLLFPLHVAQEPSLLL
eukprot:scaffold2329_cov247-Pinguiococcus_pyrenoidosus.AAC.12